LGRASSHARETASSLRSVAAAPFGPGFAEFNAWVFRAGGYELPDERYDTYNIKPVLFTVI
jgi:TRAP-type mannitol/chloroaromatic compound transport system substrate-binding protein